MAYTNFNDLTERLNQGYQQFAGSKLNLGITAQDRNLVQQGVGGATDIVMRQLQEQLPIILGQLQGNMGARGIGGSGIEGIQRGLTGQRAVSSLADMLSQQQQLGSQYLMQVPFQRAGMQMQRNQALFQNLISSVMPQYQQRMWSAEQKQQRDQGVWGMLGQLGAGAGQILPYLL